MNNANTLISNKLSNLHNMGRATTFNPIGSEANHLVGYRTNSMLTVMFVLTAIISALAAVTHFSVPALTIAILALTSALIASGVHESTKSEKLNRTGRNW